MDIEVTRVSVEWRNKVTPLREWISVVMKTVQEDNHTLDMDSLKKTRADIEVSTRPRNYIEAVYFVYRDDEKSSFVSSFESHATVLCKFVIRFHND